MRKDSPSKTLNNLLLKIFSGVNYVSKIAEETGKSIPVVFRQLEELSSYNLIKKERKGKRVEYGIEWASVVKSFISLVKEERIAQDKNAKKIFEDVFSLDLIKDSFKSFYQEIEEAGKIMDKYNKIEFRETLDLFLESFGMLNETEKRKLMETSPSSKHKSLLEFFNLGKDFYERSEDVDPRKKIKDLF